MIASYRDGDAQAVAERRRVRKFSQDLQKQAQRKLMILNNAQTLNDLRVPPSNRLEALAGNRAGQYSIRINNQWRICFEWRGGDAHGVEIVDYH